MAKTVTFLGVEVNLLNKHDLTNEVINSINTSNKTLIPNHNLHSIYLYHKYDKFREFYALSDITHVDGMSLVLLGRLFGKPVERKHRITYVDWVDELFNKLNNESKKVFYLGSKPGVASKAVEKLNGKYPYLKFDVRHGYFDMQSHENEELICKINQFNPDVLMVGMGMPRQEYWVMDNYEKLKAKVILTSGACFDYIAGETKTPPRFLGSVGLEWLYRLLNEPLRLWKRYLWEPIELIWLLTRRKF